MNILKLTKDYLNLAYRALLAVLVCGLSLGSIAESKAQTVSALPDETRNVVCIRHKRTTIITYFAERRVWCAMNNPDDCITDRGIATSRACAYGRKRAAEFLAKTEAAKAAAENNEPALANEAPADTETVKTTPAATESAAQPSTQTPAPDNQVDHQKLQDELLSLQERLVTLKKKQLELRKREATLRQRLIYSIDASS